MSDRSHPNVVFILVDKVHQMKRLPLKRDQLLGLIAGALLPFLPVLALQIRIKDLLGMFRQLL